MKPTPFEYERPAGLGEAIALLGTPDARPIAGGQSLGPMLALRIVAPGMLVDISRLGELRAVGEEPDAIVIGAGTTHAAIEDGRVPDPTRGMLATVARGIAYRAVRNRGTIGGSLSHADPSADWVSTMPALGAEMLVAGPGGERTIAARDFVTGTLATSLVEGEILRAVRIPRLSPGARWAYRKICRKTGEFAHAIGVAVLDPERGVRRVVIGATGDAPRVLEGEDPLLEALLGVDAAGLPAEAARTIAALAVTDDPLDARVHSAALARAIAAVRKLDS